MIYISLVVVAFTAFYFCLVNPNKGLEDLCPANRLSHQSGRSLCHFIGLVFIICVIKLIVDVPDTSNANNEPGTQQHFEASREAIDSDSMLRRLKNFPVWTTRAEK